MYQVGFLHILSLSLDIYASKWRSIECMYVLGVPYNGVHFVAIRLSSAYGTHFTVYVYIQSANRVYLCKYPFSPCVCHARVQKGSFLFMRVIYFPLPLSLFPSPVSDGQVFYQSQRSVNVREAWTPRGEETEPLRPAISGNLPKKRKKGGGKQGKSWER